MFTFIPPVVAEVVHLDFVNPFTRTCCHKFGAPCIFDKTAFGDDDAISLSFTQN